MIKLMQKEVMKQPQAFKDDVGVVFNSVKKSALLCKV